MPIRALAAMLWDMDGTLVDTEPLWVECESELMLRFGYQWSVEDARYCIGGPMEKVERYMAQKSKSDLPISWFGDELIGMMLTRLSSGVDLLPGVEEMIAQAREAGIKLALVSASRREIVDAVLQGTGIDFDLSISASDVQRSKPDPEGYVRATENLETTVDNCVILEDSPVGIAAGLSSGALTLGVGVDFVDHENFVALGPLQGRNFVEIAQLHSEWRDSKRVVLK